MGKYLEDFKNRFKDKGMDEEEILDLIEIHGPHKAISIIRKKYPQASDQDIDDLIGRYATTPYKLKENQKMKARFVKESLEQDQDIYDEENGEEVEVTESPLDKVEMTEDPEEDDDLVIQDEFEAALNNELKVPEYARRTVSFKVKGERGIVDAVPMAKMKDGAFLMKVGNSYRKFKMDDIVEESFKAKTIFNK